MGGEDYPDSEDSSPEPEDTVPRAPMPQRQEPTGPRGTVARRIQRGIVKTAQWKEFPEWATAAGRRASSDDEVSEKPQNRDAIRASDKTPEPENPEVPDPDALGGVRGAKAPTAVCPAPGAAEGAKAVQNADVRRRLAMIGCSSYESVEDSPDYKRVMYRLLA